MKNTIKYNLEIIFQEAFKKCDVANSPVLLKEVLNDKFGDYQVNGIFQAAKSLNIAPRDLASKIINSISEKKLIKSLEVAGGGFINIFLNDNYLKEYLINQYQQIEQGFPKQDLRVVVDYSHPNLAKEMHVGHLRSTIIGDAICKILTYCGMKVIKHNHIGDFGTQFGMLIAYLQEEEQKHSTSEYSINDLELFYQKAKTRFDEDEEFAKIARRNVVLLQNYNKNDNDTLSEMIFKKWQQFREISLEHCFQVYKKLKVYFNKNLDIIGESFYKDKLDGIVKELDNKHLLEVSDDAKCVFFKEGELSNNITTPFIVQKSDGGYLYATTDLAAIEYRALELKANRLIYVVDARQSLYFEQLFLVAKKAQFVDSNQQLQHISFGTMLNEDGLPFKTREGGTIKLISLIEEAKKKSLKMLLARNNDREEHHFKDLADILAIAAIKYADLSKSRNSDYIFSFDKMLAFEGNTAPYLLYAYTRIVSLLKKIHENDINVNDNIEFYDFNLFERKLALQLAKFNDTILQISNECYPHVLCSYLYNLSGIFMQFYENCNIIKEQNNNIIKSRLSLIIITAKTLKVGLDLLGIEVVNKM